MKSRGNGKGKNYKSSGNVYWSCYADKLRLDDDNLGNVKKQTMLQSNLLVNRLNKNKLYDNKKLSQKVN